MKGCMLRLIDLTQFKILIVVGLWKSQIGVVGVVFVGVEFDLYLNLLVLGSIHIILLPHLFLLILVCFVYFEQFHEVWVVFNIFKREI